MTLQPTSNVLVPLIVEQKEYHTNFWDSENPDELMKLELKIPDLHLFLLRMLFDSPVGIQTINDRHIKIHKRRSGWILRWHHPDF